MVDDSYEGLVRALEELNARVEAQRDEARTWYVQQCATAEQAVRRAEQQLRRAERELAVATEQAELTEGEAAHLWHLLRGRLGISAGRMGAPPAPVGGAPTDPATLLDGVRDLVERARRRGEFPPSANPLLVGCGVLGAVTASALGAAARAVGARYGGDLAVGMPVLALVVTLLGPVAGLAPAKLLAERRHVALGPRPVTLVVVAGVVATILLLVLLR